MAACDVAVIPSVAESFSRVVIEATAVATPPVVTNTTGASDYVREDDTGEVVEPRDAASLAAGIRRAVERHAELQSRCPSFAAKFHANVIATSCLPCTRNESHETASVLCGLPNQHVTPGC